MFCAWNFASQANLLAKKPMLLTGCEKGGLYGTPFWRLFPSGRQYNPSNPEWCVLRTQRYTFHWNYRARPTSLPLHSLRGVTQRTRTRCLSRSSTARETQTFLRQSEEHTSELQSL